MKVVSLNHSDKPRYSRDGDQFHYLWAARRSLLLLHPTTKLVAITVEGPSKNEDDSSTITVAGDELIDVAEYYGSEIFEDADRIRYIQLKHSTQNPNDHITASGLEKTLRGFSKRFSEIREKNSIEDVLKKIEFVFVSNRPVSADFIKAVTDVSEGVENSKPNELKKLKVFCELEEAELKAFCQVLHFEGKQDGFLDQKNQLILESRNYLVGLDADAPMNLKNLIAEKATSEHILNPTIKKYDVLRALNSDIRSLYPAPCEIEELNNALPREQEKELIECIIQSSTPIIVHAEGGVGKTVFSSNIQSNLPEGSISVLYDCFGNGQYRNVSSFRHRHKDALVQISNELSSLGLCDPLIPTQNSDASSYMRAFLFRLKQSIETIKTKNPNALLCIIIDAADNAQMAAEEIHELSSFALDLFKEEFPNQVRIIQLCRTHRIGILNPLPDVLQLELKAFNRSETKKHLLQKFKKANDSDIDEFHRLSSQNPRVQATVLAQNLSLSETLKSLGPEPTSVEDTIAHLFEQNLTNLQSKAARHEKQNINMICFGLATLRPLIPIEVLALISGVEASAIRSFAFDLGRPLRVTVNTIQFYDEPAETWFRKKYKPNATQLDDFISKLAPLCNENNYVASAMPQLLLDAGRYDDLVELALNSNDLPEDSLIDKQAVELQRLQFALKASLRIKDYVNASKLALKAAGETAGDSRLQSLIQNNTDLSSLFMSADQIQDIVSNRTFVDSWMGSHHIYESCLLSGKKELAEDARSHMRVANEWLKNWSIQPSDKREEIDTKDIAEMSFGILNISGSIACAKSLRRWTPRSISFSAGKIIAKRLVDLGRYKDLEELAFAARNDLGLIIAIANELDLVNASLPSKVLNRIIKLLEYSRIKLDSFVDLSNQEREISIIFPLIKMGKMCNIRSDVQLSKLLDEFIPKTPPKDLYRSYEMGQKQLILAYTLRAALKKQEISLEDLVPPDIKEQFLKKEQHQDSREVREFKESTGAIFPWAKLWAKIFLGNNNSDLSLQIDLAQKDYNDAMRSVYESRRGNTFDLVAEIWIDILLRGNGLVKSLDFELKKFTTWKVQQKRSLYTPTLNRLARLTGDQIDFKKIALGFANESFNLVKNEREEADVKIDGYIELSRAVYSFNPAESLEYFNESVAIANKVGDENLVRWEAILDLADAASDNDNPNPERAYKLSRCAELTYSYNINDRHFDWDGSVKSIVGICPTSSITIMSRWLDRNFGWKDKILPLTVHELLKLDKIDPVAALSLICIRVGWDHISMLESALNSCSKKTEKQLILDQFYSYMKKTKHSSSFWKKLKDLISEHKLKIVEIEELVSFYAVKNSADEENQNYTPFQREDKPSEFWDLVFEHVDLCSPENLKIAYFKLEVEDDYLARNQFYEQALPRVNDGFEIEFITALFEQSNVDLTKFENLTNSFPQYWKENTLIEMCVSDIIKGFWNDIFRNVNFTSTEDISIAYERLRASEDNFIFDQFYSESQIRVVSGQQSEFIIAFSLLNQIGLTELRVFLESIPDIWKQQLSVKKAISTTVKTICKNHYLDINRNRTYQVMPFDFITEISALKGYEIVEVVLKEIGRATEFLDSKHLFSLVGLLALKLSKKEAQNALDYGLELFNELLEEKDGDGPWSSELLPPDNTNDALAGFLWASLADPNASNRWEATHAVRFLGKSGKSDVLDVLIELAIEGKGGTFVDAKLWFYDLHALQWLLISLARVSIENPELLIRHIPFFKEIALNSVPHVLLRKFASEILQNLHKYNKKLIANDCLTMIEDVNKSQFEIEIDKKYKIVDQDDVDDRRFYFGIDMEPYWFQPLGREFAITESGVSNMVSEIIVDEWEINGDKIYELDERRSRNLYKDGMTMHSHGSYPRTDELNFYLPYHAMMIVAGKLLETEPLRQESYDDEPGFSDWLRSYGLTCSDGSWVADKRDPFPLERPVWKDEKKEDTWRWSVSKGDFDRILFTSDKKLNVHGHWNSTSGQRAESISISSALISSDNSIPLLNALQTATSHMDYRIPTADNDLSINDGGYKMEGWVVDECSDKKLDQFDPWAGDIYFPPLRPAEFVRDAMELTLNDSSNDWQRNNNDRMQTEINCQVWGEYKEKSDEDGNVEKGIRMQINYDFLIEMLNCLKSDMIVEISIRRDLQLSRYERREDDGQGGYTASYTRLYVIRQDGTINTIEGSSKPW